jgi:pimeloyl-ACP methyl ester carboxylesterase
MTKEMNQKEKILICFVLAFAFLGYACLKYNQIFGNDEIAFTKRSQFENETLRWSRCGLLQCATLMVPLNYSDPNSITIGIALNKYKPFFRKPKTRILFNPGGPGSSGMDIIKSSGFFLSSLFGGDAELIGFDPRGVGSSSPVNCVSPGPQMNYGKGYLVFGAFSLPQDASKEQKLYFDSTQKLNAELCEINAGDILGHTSTANVARDMDQMRKALGMEKLNFWGMSYGSVLGTTYANMFPDNIGNIVLDGIVDPVSYYGDAIK